jgi:hypothetical protein
MKVSSGFVAQDADAASRSSKSALPAASLVPLEDGFYR